MTLFISLKRKGAGENKCFILEGSASGLLYETVATELTGSVSGGHAESHWRNRVGKERGNKGGPEQQELHKGKIKAR